MLNLQLQVVTSRVGAETWLEEAAPTYIALSGVVQMIMAFQDLVRLDYVGPCSSKLEGGKIEAAQTFCVAEAGQSVDEARSPTLDLFQCISIALQFGAPHCGCVLKVGSH